jgi:polyisoprenoid-binding protein YceI
MNDVDGVFGESVVMARSVILAILTAGIGLPALAAPVHYTIDPEHTYPSFEVPHIQSISIWRGKLVKTTGTIVLDRQAKTGKVDITMDASSIETGHAKVDEHLRSDAFFDVAKFPSITYKADTVKFSGETPVEIDGVLTMHGVSKPVVLKLNQFKCIKDPLRDNKDVCGADASAEINRSDFGINEGVSMSSGWVKLAIQVEALKD